MLSIVSLYYQIYDLFLKDFMLCVVIKEAGLEVNYQKNICTLRSFFLKIFQDQIAT
jgi:hypothetical protein